MKVRCTHIDWDISDEDLLDNFGDTVDRNGIPFTAKDLGLPTWNDVVEVEIEDDDWDAAVENGEENCIVANELSDIYGWLINSLLVLEDDDAKSH